MKFTAWVCAAGFAVAGCGGGGSSTSTTTSNTCSSLTATSATPSPGFTGTVFTIVMENKSQSEILGSAQAPTINALASSGAVALGYKDPMIHPSEPNYLWMVAGENFGVLDDQDPSAHPIDSSSHIADQLELAGIDWKAYQESMGAPCGLTSHGSYAAKHNPFVYFDDINGWDGKKFQTSQRCIDHIVDYSQLDKDIAANTIPKYAFITPNLDHDMHNGTIAQGDAWLSTELPKIMATDAFKNGGVIFLLWDEGDTSSGAGASNKDDPPFIVISPLAKTGMQSQVAYDTSSYLKTVQTILGVDQLPCSSDPSKVSTMYDLFATSL